MLNLFSLLCILLCSGALVQSAETLLFEQGRTCPPVIAADGSDDLNSFALRELTDHLEKITGRKFPVRSSAVPGTAAIYLGLTPAARKALGPSFVPPVLHDQDSVVQITGGSLFLYGKGICGTLYAVYDFLENHLDCHWLSANGDSLIPRRDRIALPDGIRITHRAFRKRSLMNDFHRRSQNAMLFFCRNRQNMMLLSKDSSSPTRFIDSRCPVRSHQLNRLIPGNTLRQANKPHAILQGKNYFRSNPEWFSMDEKGRRVSDRQVCFSNPELRRELTRNALLTYLAETDAKTLQRYPDGKYLVIDLNDISRTICCCEKCRALQKKYHTRGGPLFDYLIEVCNDHPEIEFMTIAYQKNLTQVPPKLSSPLPSNLTIIFAAINGNFAAPLTQARNRSDFEDLKGWSRLTGKLWSWYYPNPYNRETDLFFVHPPTAVLARTAADIRILRDHGFEGTFFEHDSGGVQLSTNFSELDTWVMLKLFENPDLDYRKLAGRFIDMYYGGIPEIRQYYDELSMEMQNLMKHNGYWNYRTINADYLTRNNLMRWDKLMDRAFQRASEEVRPRLQMLRLGLDSTIIALLGDRKDQRLERMRQGLTVVDQRTSLYVRWPKFNQWRQNMLQTTPADPLPAAAAKISGVVSLDVPATGAAVVRRADASGKRAFAEKSSGGQGLLLCLGRTGARSPVITGHFAAETLSSTKFTWHELTKIPLTLDMDTELYSFNRKITFLPGRSCCHRDDPDSLKRKWRIFVSLKAENNLILCDRVLVFPAENCPEKMNLQ